MKYAGHTFKRVDGLAARPADPSRDEDHAGNPVPADRTIIVSKKTAPKNDDGYVDAESIQRAAIVPGLHFPEDPLVIYGPARKQERRGRFFWVPSTEFTSERNFDREIIYLLDGMPTTVDEWHDFEGTGEMSGRVWFDEYWTHPIYYVKDGNVFRASYHDWRPPKDKSRVADKHRA
jgi:hypothetical protein